MTVPTTTPQEVPPKTGWRYWTSPKGLFELFLLSFVFGLFFLWLLLSILAGIVTILFPLAR